MNKTVGVMEHLNDQGCDICFVQETFLKEADTVKIQEIKSYGWEVLSNPRKHRGGGGIAFLYKPEITMKANEKVAKYKTFQVMESLLQSDMEEESVRLVNLYRPPYTQKARYTESMFLEEFENYLDDLSTKNGIPLLMGDFNIHMERPDDLYPGRLKRLLENYDLHQYMPIEPTHDQGGTIDLIISSEQLSSRMGAVSVSKSGTSSDHFLIHFDLKYECHKKPKMNWKKVHYRDFKSLDKEIFRDALINSSLNQDSFDWTLDEAVAQYNEVLSSLMDTHCPVMDRKVKARDTPWIDDELRDVRRMRRRAERAWRSGKGPKSRYKELQASFQAMEFIKRKVYYRDSINASAGDIKTLYKKVNRLLGNSQTSVPSGNPKEVADRLKDFFSGKVEDIRSSIESMRDMPTEPKQCTCEDGSEDGPKLEHFREIEVLEMETLVKSMSNKFCDLDPIPMFLLKYCIKELAPVLCYIVNLSIQTAKFPSDLKRAVVRPTLKKDGLDPDCLKNYRPVSNLPVMSKILEKAVLSQLNEYLDTESLHCPVQSGYRPRHSCETLLVRMTDDILHEIEQGKVVTLILLDLSAAFDTIDHKILVKKLLADFGITGKAKSWFEDYLHARSFSVKVGQELSDAICLLFGVPQGSLLGPILFILYIKHLQMIAAKFGIRIQLYADDSQLYISFHPLVPGELNDIQNRINACLDEIRTWMIDNFMKLNESKTELLVIGKPSVLREIGQSQISVSFGITNVVPTECVGDNWKSLGVKLDPALSMERQLNSVKQKSVWALANLKRIQCYLSEGLKIMLVKQLVISKLDYCNSLYISLPMKSLKKLKSVLNAGVRFIYSIEDYEVDLVEYYKRAHILPIEERIRFKICLLAYKVMYNLAPPYLEDLLQVDTQVASSKTRHLSGDNLRFKVGRPSKIRLGDRRFSNAAPIIWNSLPYTVRKIGNIDTFKRALKTHFFKCIEHV